MSFAELLNVHERLIRNWSDVFMSLRSALKLPKEHGAWAMLYVPFALGVAVVGRVNWQVLLLLLSATAVFISRESLLLYWRACARGRAAPEAGRALSIYLALA